MLFTRASQRFLTIREPAQRSIMGQLDKVEKFTKNGVSYAPRERRGRHNRPDCGRLRRSRRNAPRPLTLPGGAFPTGSVWLKIRPLVADSARERPQDSPLVATSRGRGYSNVRWHNLAAPRCSYPLVAPGR